LIGADGSTLRLPESNELSKEFGRWKTIEDADESPPMARISEYNDMTTKLVLSGRIAPCSTSEEELAKEQLKEVVTIMRKYAQEKMLFVYDRGYPSEEFIQLHIDLE
ncbi:MAG: IS4 family transposase, partial [Chitinophagia bacterium]|nr:IS4 family transposase [Chitinophagia bacterium]